MRIKITTHNKQITTASAISPPSPTTVPNHTTQLHPSQSPPPLSVPRHAPTIQKNKCPNYFESLGGEIHCSQYLHVKEQHDVDVPLGRNLLGEEGE